MFENRILPHPQDVRFTSKRCFFKKLRVCKISGLKKESIKVLKEDFQGMKLEETESKGFSAVFCVSEDSLKSTKKFLTCVPVKKQGYLLSINFDKIEIHAHDAEGLWFGFQTLIQLLRAGKGIVPQGEIRDWPKIRRRGIHIDLKGYQPKFEKLVEMCRILSEYKINTILLEVEDKYDFSSAPRIGISSAYSFEQLRELSALCSQMFIQVIPKLQCLGHADYILKHERYKHLRENGHPYQFCPRNEEGMELWKAMAGELIECFKEHDFFHIGADETTNLGECPICSQYTKSECYIYRVQKCIDFVIEKVKKPIMWEDILRNLHGHLSEKECERTWVLGRKAVLMYWAYGYGGKGNTFPMLPKYLAKGMKVWGASGFSGCGPSWIQNIPPLRERALNISAWTKTAVKNRLEAVMTTGWTRIASADPPAESPEASWFPILYAAESMWWGKERNLSDFCRVMSQSFFGKDISDEYLQYLLTMEPGRLPGEGVCKKPEINQKRFELFSAASHLSSHGKLRQDLYNTLHMYYGTIGKKMPDYRLEMIRKRSDTFRDSLEKRRNAMRAALEEFYESDTISEVIESQFGRDAELVTQADQLARETNLV